MHKLSAHRATIYWILVVLIFFIPYVSGCGGSEIQGLENAGNTIDGSSASKSLYSADKDKSSKECLYSKVTYTLDNGKTITYQFDPDTLSAVTPSKSSTQETRSSGVTRQAYDGTVMGLGDSKAAYVTDKLIATTNAYTFFPGAGIAEEYIVCPEPSVYPESNVPRQGVTVVPSPESGLGPITYTPTAPSFTGAVHIVANYLIPDDPPKPWHESWDYVYLVGNPVPVLTQYYSENGNVMGLQFTMGMGSDTENVVLPRTLGGWHFISNNNMSHSDDIINMRELRIKDTVTFVADASISNKIKVQAEIEELSAGSWTANIARAKDVIVDPNTQETSTIDLIWDPAKKYLAGDWIYNSGVITAALSKGLSLTAREIAYLYMHTITAYEDTVKTFAMRSAGQEIAKLTIENAKATPKEFVPPGTTTITATVTAKDFTPVNLKWTLTIKNDKTGATAHTSKGGATQISVPWELSKAKNFPGYGNYTFDIKATCKDGAGNSYEAKVSEAIKVKPPTPKITLIKFVQPIHMVDDNGKKIETVYYSEKDGAVKQNPIAFAWSEIGATSDTASSQTASKDASDSSKDTTMKMTFQLEKAPLEPITYKFRSVSAEQGEVILKDYSVAFEKHKTEKESNITIVAPQMVNYIDDLTWQYSSGSEDGGTSTYNDLVQTQEPICVALNPPPIKNFKILKALEVIATKQAKGAKTPEDIRKNLVSGTWEYLHNNGFWYDTSPGHAYCDYSGIHQHKIHFHYTAWKNTPGRRGDCVAASSLYHILCELAGAETNLKRLRSKDDSSYKINLAKWFGRPSNVQEFDDNVLAQADLENFDS